MFIHFFPFYSIESVRQEVRLSGGEQQMLAISRALMARPRLLLLDEPSLGLAPLVVKRIFNIIKQINKENDTTIFLVEQNANMALQSGPSWLRNGKWSNFAFRQGSEFDEK
jgi:branched-chain amino acid transport system ATP-binding protein